MQSKEKNKVATYLVLRQAGRYLPEYQTSEKINLLGLCSDPKLAAEVTCNQQGASI